MNLFSQKIKFKMYCMAMTVFINTSTVLAVRPERYSEVQSSFTRRDLRLPIILGPGI